MAAPTKNPFLMSKRDLRDMMLSLPDTHPAKIVRESWPCGNHVVSDLVWANAPRTCREQYASSFTRVDPSLPFITFGNETRTYAQTWGDINALGAALVTEFGLMGGDRVAISMRNYPEWCVTFLAIQCAGLVVVPLNSLWKGQELTYGLNDSGTKLLVCDQERLAFAADALAKLHIPALVCRADKDLPVHRPVVRYEEVIERHRGRQPPPPVSGASTDDVTAIFYTSGSTGSPKGVCQTHRGICQQLYYQIAMKSLEGDAGKRPQDAMVCGVPLFHVTGMRRIMLPARPSALHAEVSFAGSHHIFLTAMITGSRLVLMFKWDALEALRIIDREKPTAWLGVPTMVQDMMEHPRFAEFDTSSLTRLGGGGGPTPKSQVRTALCLCMPAHALLYESACVRRSLKCARSSRRVRMVVWRCAFISVGSCRLTCRRRCQWVRAHRD